MCVLVCVCVSCGVYVVACELVRVSWCVREGRKEEKEEDQDDAAKSKSPTLACGEQGTL